MRETRDGLVRRVAQGAPHVVTEDDEMGGIVCLTWLQSTTDCDKET